MSLTASYILGTDVELRPTAQGGTDGRERILGSIDFRKGYDGSFYVLAMDPAQMDRLAEAAQAAAQLMRDRIAATETPAPARSVGAE